MLNGLQRFFFRFRRRFREFLESDLGWLRTGFLIMVGVVFTLMMVLVDFFVHPESGVTWLMSYPPLDFLPDSLLRWIGLAVTWNSLRYFLLPLVTMGLALLTSALYIQDIFNLNDYQIALRYLIASVFSVSYPFLKIEKGQKVLSPGEINPLAIIGGPGYVLVAPGNAVLFERLTQRSGVRGQGLHFISRFESIKEIVDLTDQHGTIERSAAMTKDGIVVSVHNIRYNYRLWSGQNTSDNAGRSAENPYPFSVRAVRNMVYNRSIGRDGAPTPWQDVVRGMVEGEILSYIRAHLLDDLTTPMAADENETDEKIIQEKRGGPRGKIVEKIFSYATKKRFRDVGAELLWVDIGRFGFEEPAVEEQRIRTWSADWIGESELLRARGISQRQAFQEMARAQVQAEMVMALVNSLHEAGLSGELRGEAMQKLMLIKTAQLIDSMSGVYEPSPNGE